MRLKAWQQPRLRGGLSAHTGRGTPVCREQVQEAASLKTRLHKAKRTQSAWGGQTARSVGHWGSAPV